MTDGDGGKVAIDEVREIKTEPRGTLGGDPDDALEGCMADDVGGSLFVGEQDWHIWRYGAEHTDPTGTADRVMVDSDVSEGGHFARDVEGLTLVNTPGGEGYLIGSSQGDYTYTVYRSTAPYEFVRKVKVVAQGGVGGCERTEGIDATALSLGPAFPQGMFVCQDNYNTPTRTKPHGPQVRARRDHVSPRRRVDPHDHPLHDPTTTPTATTPTTGMPHGDPPGGPPAGRSGYWMLGARGDAVGHGSVPAGTLRAGETVTSLSPTRTGGGYWIFTTLGRVFPYGDAAHLGDMGTQKLNAPVLDSITTPSGAGYYMVAADGGIFTFGDATFHGSMGGTRLNQPVQSLVPDPDATGYWLVASDGGVFSFDAPFRGSMAGTKLNRPVTGMVAFGDGYLMVAQDGGIFTFTDKAFHGSLGANPPTDPITSTAALD